MEETKSSVVLLIALKRQHHPKFSNIQTPIKLRWHFQIGQIMEKLHHDQINLKLILKSLLNKILEIYLICLKYTRANAIEIKQCNTVKYAARSQ